MHETDAVWDTWGCSVLDKCSVSLVYEDVTCQVGLWGWDAVLRTVLTWLRAGRMTLKVMQVCSGKHMLISLMTLFVFWVCLRSALLTPCPGSWAISLDRNVETETRDICSQNNRGRLSARALIDNRCSTSIEQERTRARTHTQKWDTYLLCRVWASAGVSVPWLNPRSSQPGAVPGLCPWLINWVVVFVFVFSHPEHPSSARVRVCVCCFPRADPPCAGGMLQFARRRKKRCRCWRCTAIWTISSVNCKKQSGNRRAVERRHHQYKWENTVHALVHTARYTQRVNHITGVWRRFKYDFFLPCRKQTSSSIGQLHPEMWAEIPMCV